MTEYRIKVFAEQKKEEVKIVRDGRLYVYVNAKREEGRANERTLILLATHLGVSLEALMIVKGHNQPTKTIRLHENLH